VQKSTVSTSIPSFAESIYNIMAATNSNSQQKTQNESSNQQTGSGTGGAAIGAGGYNNTINVTNSDVQTVQNALDTVRDTVTSSTMANLATSQAALAANNHATDSAIGGIVAVTGQAGALLQSSFTQFTGALSDANNSALVAQNNASNAGLNIIANAAPQTNASLQEHLAGVSVIPASEDINSAPRITVTSVVVVGLVLAALYLILRNN
jgi:hypothetical protein